MNPLGEREQQNQRQFDALADSYDQVGFLTLSAQYVARHLAAQPGQAVLDIMSGTGEVALAVAASVGEGSRVVGADLSGGMLEVARSKAAGLTNVSFTQADATKLPFADASFDVVVCASGLFFVPDMLAALREWQRVLRPGGQVVFSAFGSGLLGELPGLWRSCLARHGVKPASPPLGRLPTPGAAQQLLLEAGFTQVRVQLEPLPYTLATPGARWADITAGLEGQPLAQFTLDQAAQIRAQHLAELASLFAAGPLTVPVPVITAYGVRPT